MKYLLIVLTAMLAAGAGGELHAQPARDAAKPYEADKPLLFRGNGGSEEDFLYRSVLAPWRENYNVITQDIINETYNEGSQMIAGRVQVHQRGIADLYRIAFGDSLFNFPSSQPNTYGKAIWEPILETRDSAIVRPKQHAIKGYYNYSLIVPPGKSSSYLRRAMQAELKSYFHYDAVKDLRVRPCWIITVTPEGQKELRKPYVRPTDIGPGEGFKFRKGGMLTIVEVLNGYFEEEGPFVDESYFTEDFGLAVRVSTANFNAVLAALAKVGIVVKKGLRPMNVLIIRDPK